MDRDHRNDVHESLFGARPTTGQRGDGQEQLELAAVVLAVAVAAVVGLWWLTGQVAASLSGHGWPGVSANVTTRALWAWPRHWANPTAGYPATTAICKVSPLAWWAALVVLVATAAALGWVVWRKVQHHQTGQQNRWAQSADLRNLTVRSASTGRLVLGSVDRRLVATERRHSVLVVGPTESGKTSGFAVPALLEWRGPAVAVSVKSDLAEHTLVHRSRQGEVWVYDPCQTTNLPASTWSPIAAMGSWERALRFAQDVTDAAKTRAGREGQLNAFWYQKAAQLLAPYLFAAAQGHESMGTVFRWALTHDHEQSKALLVKAGNRVALDQHDSILKAADPTRSSAFFTLQEALAVYADTRVAASTASSDIDIAKLLDGSSRTLYVAAPINDQKALQPLFSSLLAYVIAEAYTRVATHGPFDPPLLVLVDEAANVAPIRELPSICSTAASQGIQLVTVWQDLAQVRSRYQHDADTILSNHRARIVLRGSGDENTLKWVSTLVGDAKGTAGPRGARPAVSSSEHTEPLLPVHAARQMPDYDGVLLYGHLPAAKLKLRPWYRNRRLRRRATPTDESTIGKPPDGGEQSCPPTSQPLDAAAPAPPGTGAPRPPQMPALAQRAATIDACAAECTPDGGGEGVGGLTGHLLSTPPVPGNPLPWNEQAVQPHADVIQFDDVAARRVERLEAPDQHEQQQGHDPETGA